MSKLNEDVRKVLTELTGIEVAEDATIDDVKASFGENYVSKELHTKEVQATAGKIKGTTETKLKKVLGEQAKGKSYDEMLELLPAHVEHLHEEIKKAQAANDSEEVARLRAERDEFEKLANENAKTIETLQTERDLAKSEADQRIEQFKTEAAVQSAWNGAKWSDTVSPHTKLGVWAGEIQGKFQFKVENGQTMVYDAEGNIYTGGTPKQLTAEALFEQILKKTGTLKVNPGGKPPIGDPGNPDPNMSEAQLKAMRRLQERMAASKK